MATVVADYLLRADFSNAVNAKESVQAEPTKVYPVVIHHEDIPGVFAKIDNILGRANINIRETSSRQFGPKALTVYLLHQKIDDETYRKLRELPAVKRVVC